MKADGKVRHHREIETKEYKISEKFHSGRYDGMKYFIRQDKIG